MPHTGSMWATGDAADVGASFMTRLPTAERFDDRALEGRVLVAGMNKRAQRLAHPRELRDFLVDLGDSPFGDLPDSPAVSSRTSLKLEEFFDLVERESELLSALDEPHSGYSVGGKLAIARRAPRRFGKQSPPLVVPDRLNVDAGLLRRLADPHDISMNPTHGYRVKQSATRHVR